MVLKFSEDEYDIKVQEFIGSLSTEGAKRIARRKLAHGDVTPEQIADLM